MTRMKWGSEKRSGNQTAGLCKCTNQTRIKGKDEKRRPEGGQDDVPFSVSAGYGEFLRCRLTFHKAHLGFSGEGTGPRRRGRRLWFR